jgi:hypothetical protein
MRTRKRERGEWERRDFGMVTIGEEYMCEMRRGRHYFVLGKGDKPLLDELQVSHIQEK